jgi:putative transcriptional regulator
VKIIACLLAACLTAAGFAARAQDITRPVMLVASPALKGPYQHSTVVAVPAGGKHIGFILNRATDVKLASLLPNYPASAKVTGPVHIGGPEMFETLFVMVRRNPGGQSLRLLDDLFVTGTAETIQQIIEQTPNDARYLVGFVGWTDGELESEVERGLWLVTEPDAGVVFRDDTGSMWEELVKRLGSPRTPRARGLVETSFSN